MAVSQLDLNPIAVGETQAVNGRHLMLKTAQSMVSADPYSSSVVVTSGMMYAPGFNSPSLPASPILDRDRTLSAYEH